MLKALWEEIRNITPHAAAVRSFGRVVGGVLLLIAGVVFWRSGWELTPWVIGLGVPGLLLPVLQLVYWPVLKPVFRFWMGLAFVLGFIMTNLILSAVYLLLVTPIGVGLRLLGKDPLAKKPDPRARSYWIRKEYRDESPARLEKYY